MQTWTYWNVFELIIFKQSLNILQSNQCYKQLESLLNIIKFKDLENENLE